MTILANASDYNVPVSVNTKMDFMPYTLSVANEKNDNKDQHGNSAPFDGNTSWFSQAGLGLRTYLSDRFNNWLSTE